MWTIYALIAKWLACSGDRYLDGWMLAGLFPIPSRIFQWLGNSLVALSKEKPCGGSLSWPSYRLFGKKVIFDVLMEHLLYLEGKKSLMFWMTYLPILLAWTTVLSSLLSLGFLLYHNFKASPWTTLCWIGKQWLLNSGLFPLMRTCVFFFLGGFSERSLDLL